MARKFDYDLVTIGAGSGGVRASRRSAGFGARAAVIENLRVGGTCVMRGCVPKKLLVLGSHFAEDFDDARGYGWTPGEAVFDWPSLIKAKDRELDRLEAVYHRILRESGVTEIEGTGKISDPHTVEVEGQTLTAANILVATGGWPSKPEIPGIEHTISSNEALDLPALPKRVAVVGGGYIAVEFAGIFNSFGARVTEIIRAPNILRGFDEDVRVTLADEMKKKGVTVRSDTVVEKIERKNGAYRLAFKGGDALEVDTVMYATGRAPNTRNIGLDEVGVKIDNKGAVAVDEYSRSSVESIWAIGDVTERKNLTPVALAEGEALAWTLFGGRPTKMAYENIASAVFSQPPIGTVGLSEEQAARNGPVDVYVSKFTPMKHTLTGRDEKTMMKLIVDRKSDRVVGCHMVGADAPEIIQGIAIALKCGATKAQFDATIGIHPTAAEEFVTLRERRPAKD